MRISSRKAQTAHILKLTTEVSPKLFLMKENYSGTMTSSFPIAEEMRFLPWGRAEIRNVIHDFTQRKLQ
jgi:hypothetical protein